MTVSSVIAVALFASIMLPGCSSSLRYYRESQVVNSLSVGMTKQALLNTWQWHSREYTVAGLRIRAARQTETGTLLEVGEIPLLSDEPDKNYPYSSDWPTKIYAYWLLFENGRLVQWGRPQDWRAVSQRYDIHYNPSLGIPR
jgi:hypothetical protein